MDPTLIVALLAAVVTIAAAAAVFIDDVLDISASYQTMMWRKTLGTYMLRLWPRRGLTVGWVSGVSFGDEMEIWQTGHVEDVNRKRGEVLVEWYHPTTGYKREWRTVRELHWFPPEVVRRM